MSSEPEQPKLKADVTNKPKVAVASVKPNMHMNTTLDQDADEQDEIDGAIVNKRKVFGATRRPSLMKVKEIDHEDDHHSTTDADKKDPKRPAESKETEDDDQKAQRKQIIESKLTEDDDGQNDLRRRKIEARLTEDAEEEDPERAAESMQTEDALDIVPYDAHGEIALRGRNRLHVPSPEHERGESPRRRPRKGGWAIRKDDEFFHFIIVCFAIGMVLVCYHNYADWTVSAGIGLLTFASLETIGIYFGFVDRIRTVLEGFLPLLRRSAISGFSK